VCPPVAICDVFGYHPEGRFVSRNGQGPDAASR
jgi:hypothetical protein